MLQSLEGQIFDEFWVFWVLFVLIVRIQMGIDIREL